MLHDKQRVSISESPYSVIHDTLRGIVPCQCGQYVDCETVNRMVQQYTEFYHYTEDNVQPLTWLLMKEGYSGVIAHGPLDTVENGSCFFSFLEWIPREERPYKGAYKGRKLSVKEQQNLLVTLKASKVTLPVAA